MSFKKKLEYILFICIIILVGSCAAKPEYSSRQKLTYMVQSNKAELPDSPFANELSKKTGIDVKYIVAQPGNYLDQLNILKLSSSLPDIIENAWLNYSGGVSKAISDGYIIPLNDLIERCSPNLVKYLKDHPEINRQVLTDDGVYYAYPFLRDDSSLNVYSGFIIRTDWLEESELSIPETIDDWENVLTVFRDKYHANSPIMLSANNYFKAAFNLITSFYIDNGTVKFSYSEPAYKDYLILMNRWYNEGFFQPTFPTQHMSDSTIMMQNGKCGALFGTAGNTLGSLLNAGVPVIGTPYPVKNKGDIPFSSQYDGQYTPQNAAAISPSCRIPETAAKLLDFGYSYEGILLYNFGVEDKSYTLINGRPFFTDLILKNPDGHSAADTMSRYIRANTSAPCIQTAEYFRQYVPDERQQLSLKRWQQTDVAKHQLPPLYFIEDELDTYSLRSKIEIYASKAEIEFIIGIRSIDDFASYLAELSEMGLDELLKCYRSAYERYLTK